MSDPVKISMGTIALLLLAVAGSAQTTDDGGKPTPPFVAPIPDFFQWTITVTDKTQPALSPQLPDSKNGSPALPGTNPSSNGNAGVKPTKIVCTKTRDIKYDVISLSNGNRSEIWYNHGMVMQQTSSGEILMDGAHGNNAELFVSKLSSEGFLGVDWIKADNFERKQKKSDGTEVYIYKGSVMSQTSQSHVPEFARRPTKEQSKPEKLEATIDVKTGFPLMAKRGDVTFEYSYQTPPAQMLELPPTFQGKLTEMDKRQKAVEELRALIRR